MDGKRAILSCSKGEKMINFIIWLIVGALIGWVASLIMKTNSRQGLIGDILVGIVGAFVGGLILSPVFHISTINESNFSLPALLVSLGGAIILLLLFKLFRKVGWIFVLLFIVLIIYTYVSCWSLESTSTYCNFVRAIPFP
jgi:uncharacterized membrane protein YeaQ/YmgE (transglycosylase-associated protein family)